MPNFEPHGDFSIDTENNLLVICACGAWNIETSKAYSRACKSKIQRHFSEQPFYVLISTHDWLPTHDSLEILREMTQWAVRHGMQAQAYCFSNPLEAELLNSQVNRDEPEYVLRKSFSYEGAARQWLKLVALEQRATSLKRFEQEATELSQ